MNNKGFTLIELMAVFVILGVLMTLTVANIVGITTANRTQGYAEDAIKFKNDVEYRFRGDGTIQKPKQDRECVIANLKYVSGSEFDVAPYGGIYSDEYSYVVMTKVNKEYKFYVQLVEKIPDNGGYRGYKLELADNLTGDGYVDRLDESTSLNTFGPNLDSERANPANLTTKLKFEGTTICDNILSIHYVE